MTKPWLPPRSGLHSTDVWNALVALSGQAIALEGASSSFTLTDAPRADAWCLALTPRGTDATLLAHIRSYPFQQRHDVELNTADIALLPSGLHEALYQGIVSDLSSSIAPTQPDFLQLSAQNVLTAFKDFSTSTIQWFALEVTGADGLTIALDLGADRSVLLHLVGARLPEGSPARSQLAEHIHVPADITLGSISLTFAELATLEPGAVVVLAERDPATVQLRLQQQVLDLARGEDGWRCVRSQPLQDFAARVRLYNHHEGQGMSDDVNEVGLDPALPVSDNTHEAAAETEVSSVDALRVTIDFDIGRLSVPLAALSQWQAGTLVDLDPPALADGVAVTIRANGDAVGTGDLVRIDDRIAVRITRFLQRS